MDSSHDDLKSFLITAIHANRIAAWQDLFYKDNGRDPTHDERNAFVAFMMATNSVQNDASKLTNDFVKKFSKPPKHSIFTNTTYTLTVCGLLLVLAIILYEHKIPSFIESGGAAFFVSACALILIGVIFTVMDHLSKK